MSSRNVHSMSSATVATLSSLKPALSHRPTWQSNRDASRPSGLSRRSATASPVLGSLSLVGGPKPASPASNPVTVSSSAVKKTARLPKFTLESGYSFPSVTVAYQTWGTLSPLADNAVLVCHSLTNAPDVDSWWPGLLGDDDSKALDVRKLFVICINVLGSPVSISSIISWLFSPPSVWDHLACEHQPRDWAGVWVDLPPNNTAR